jgi:hypothetical protein
MAVIDVVWAEPAATVFSDDADPAVFFDGISSSFQPFITLYSDPIYSPYSFMTSLSVNNLFVTSPTGLNSFWLHFDINTGVGNPTEAGSTPIDGIASVIFYHNNIKQFRMGRGNGSYTDWYFLRTLDNGITWDQVGGVITLPQQTLMTLDLKVTIDATVGAYQLFKDGTSLISFTGDVDCTSGLVSKIQLRSGATVVGLANTSYSQIVLANESTVGWKLLTLNVTGDNAPGAFLGDWTRVNDHNYVAASVRSVSTDITNSSILFDMTDTVVNSLVIDSVWTSTRKKRTANAAPTKSVALMKIGATVYEHPDVTTSPPDEEIVSKQRWSANPSNNSGWVPSAVDNLQIGYKVKT